MNVSQAAEEFFRRYYKSMCGYCAGMGFNYADVEEVCVDVILEHYEEYRERAGSDAAVCRWASRRVMLDLTTMYRRHRFSRVEDLPPDYADQSNDAFLSLDNPEDIFSLKQRLPAVPEILIDYQQFAGAKSERGENESNDRVKFCRARQRFLAELDDGVPRGRTRRAP